MKTETKAHWGLVTGITAIIILLFIAWYVDEVKFRLSALEWKGMTPQEKCESKNGKYDAMELKVGDMVTKNICPYSVDIFDQKCLKKVKNDTYKKYEHRATKKGEKIYTYQDNQWIYQPTLEILN